MNNFNRTDNNKLLWWLVGFTDGDGYFAGSVLKDQKAIKYIYGFHLHTEDSVALNVINSILKTNATLLTRKSEDLTSIDIMQQNIIKDVVIPLFTKYPLITIKYYGFLKWADQFNHYINRTKSWEWYQENKHIINDYKPIPNVNIHYENINISWLIGFIEAEGSFILEVPKSTSKNKVTRIGLSITQDGISVDTLNEISKFIKLWELSKDVPLPIKLFFEEKINIDANWVNVYKNSKDRTFHLLLVTNMDLLYYIVLPILKTQPFLTRKAKSFKLWEIALNIIIRGLHNTNEGMILLNLLKKEINKYNSKIELELLIVEYENVIKITPIYNINLPYSINATIYHRGAGGIYVFDKTNIELVKVFKGAVVAKDFFKVSQAIVRKYTLKPIIVMGKYIVKNSNYIITEYIPKITTKKS